jgi:hypothetical protein
MKYSPAFHRFGIALLAVLLPVVLSAGEPGPDEFVGRLDEGRTYRRLNGEAITGSVILDFIVEQEWEKELAAFAERELVRSEMVRLKVLVSDQEIDAEIVRQAVDFARRNGIDPKLLTPDVLASKLGSSLAMLRDQQRTQLGLRKILVLEKKLKDDAKLEDPNVRSILSQRLESIIKEKNVVCDPAKLPPDVGVRIGDRSYPRTAVRAFILERLGPVLRRDLTRALEAITLSRLVHKVFVAQGKEALTEDDRIMHLSYLSALMEMERGLPDGRSVLLQQFKEQKIDVKSYMQQPDFTFDATLTWLARNSIREAQIRAEFDAHPEKYRLQEKRLAHLFLRVRDLEGRGYTPQWETPEHPIIQEFVSAEREKRFAAIRNDIERLVPLAKNNFAAAVRDHSEDEETRRKDEPGLIGRLSERSSPPEPLDADVLKAALKLKPGEISAPLRSAYGWHIVKCLDDQTTRYEEARHFVYLSLLKEKRHALFRDLREGVKIEDTF